MKIQTLRRGLQILVLLLVINAGLGYALGWMNYGVERFCPFGGIETLWALATKQSFTCATGPFNLSLMLALLALTLLARKSFCSWVCPVGTLSEWLGRAGRALRRRRRGGREATLGFLSPSSRSDGPGRLLRLAVLAAVLFFTLRTGELIFRPFDPYYVLFSAHGHDVVAWSYAVVGGLMLAGILLPMAWCRYLCPLGGALWPFSRAGWLRLRRGAEACTGCGRCDAACPHGIPVSGAREVDSGECTLCLDCAGACPAPNALALTIPGPRSSPVPSWTVALLVLLAAGAGYLGAGLLEFSSYERMYAAATGPIARASLFVDGVRCVDTAESAARQLDGAPGLVSLTAYAADNRLDLAFQADASVESFARRLEAPVWDEAGARFLFKIFHVREIRSEKP